ncbi:MAG: BMP family ABC transporter substrate-binding protein [Clostridia bacterium]|nr:BMP family ABC transporter substrate-binding protein [Clostridia bacterium]
MKKLIAVLIAAALMFTLAACGNKTDESAGGADNADGATIKVGLVCIGDENDQGYTYNFVRATETAKEELAKDGINVEWIIKYNLIEGEPVKVANEELAEEGCAIVFNNSYGQEPAMLEVAPNYPDVQFVGLTNEGSWKDDLENTHNAFARIHEGRYVAGVVAGMKLQEMIDNGDIKEDEAIIGYVGAYSFAEVVSGYTAYFLGARSVCPSVTMKVQFVGSWSDATLEANAAQALIDEGCVMISQHSDNTTPATTAEKAGVFHTGYNADMISAAPAASIISTRIDWTNYFVYAIKAVANGEKFDQDYSHGIAEGEVVLTELNEKIAAKGTADKIKEVMDQIANGEIKIFDTSKFTVEGKEVTTCFAIDVDGDFTPDEGEAIWDGEFHESAVPDLMSAPYFNLSIDGITRLNEAF